MHDDMKNYGGYA